MTCFNSWLTTEFKTIGFQFDACVLLSIRVFGCIMEDLPVLEISSNVMTCPWLSSVFDNDSILWGNSSKNSRNFLVELPDGFLNSDNRGFVLSFKLKLVNTFNVSDFIHLESVDFAIVV